MSEIRTTALAAGESVPVLGQGTWMMGEHDRHRATEVRALQAGIDLGMTLIDTAEMYASGGSEEVVAEAIAGRRQDVFIVSKVLPGNASRAGTISACERSLERLRVDTIDLYLLHWPSNHPLHGTVDAFEQLRAGGKIRYWGVSNFDAADMEELTGLGGGGHCQTDQVLYNLTRRGIEHDLVPWARGHKMPLMAYSPIEQGRLARNRALEAMARRYGVSSAQIALAWVLAQPDVIAIPKAASEAHVRENRAAHDIILSPEDRAALDAAFPPPKGARPLEML
jgi:diketogulonate reductase-like aldo/keto reductase